MVLPSIRLEPFFDAGTASILSPHLIDIMARAPPARPHIGIQSSFSLGPEWGEDDAWDSTSDSEEPRQSSFGFNRTPSKSAPKPVPRPKMNESTSTLASSYTHLNAPGPGSYPPRTPSNESGSPPHQNGWTIVDTQAHRNGTPTHHDDLKASLTDIDVEVLGEMEPEASLTSPRDATHVVESRAFIRDDAEDIVNDPLHALKHRSRRADDALQRNTPRQVPNSHDSKERNEKLIRERSIKSNRTHKFIDCLSAQDVNIAELRKLAWAGIPNDLRPMAWQLLLGYLPLPSPTRLSTLKRKREEYLSLVELAFARDREGLDQQIWHQIEIDVPRTRPGVGLWMHAATQRSLERILYVWAIRHPASGYVQGINDLVTPFFQIFLSAYIDCDPEAFDPSCLPETVVNAIEADSFWCLSRLLDGIQDNYISAQPGIQRSVRRMAELVARIDAPLHTHLEAQNVEFMQFAFRWMNCLLMREISVKNTIRMWDTYLAEGPDAFSQFHLYVCSAFLVRWSEKLRQMDFQGVIMFLQSLPTQGWGDHEIEMLLSEAFVLNSIWHNAQSHFTA
ncbi:rab-GTPase-TBC domain-containing protein [Flagelloscypha sp. PMI_526]|nr:rab-GTPase-TBC domain-containing protein [Flagelloscypha sp. PMI_526]